MRIFQLKLFVCLDNRSLVIMLAITLLPSCTFLSNHKYIREHPELLGVRRIAVFLQRWPVYLQKSAQMDLGAEFIKAKTYFWAPWKPAVQINSRAVDIKDIDDCQIGELIEQVLGGKGAEVTLVEYPPPGAESLTAAAAMAQYQMINPTVDAFLFVYYSPTLFLSRDVPIFTDLVQKSCSLQEIIQRLSADGSSVIWVGDRNSRSPANSISHAFIYLSMTLFKAWSWEKLLEVADAQVAGKVHPWIPECLPGPTDLDYSADAGAIRRLMMDNLTCRLTYIYPEVF